MALSSYGYVEETTDGLGGNMSALDFLNVSDNATKEAVPLIKQPLHILVVYTLAYGLVFIIGLIGNGFVITVIYKDPGMRNVTNYFILNLAVADLLVVIICVPITLMGSIFTGECSLFDFDSTCIEFSML